MLRFLAIAGALTIALFGATVAAAAPDNKNTETFEVKCEGFGGKLTVSSNGEGEVVFTADGQPLVAKSISATSKATLSVEDGPTFRFTDTFEEASPGSGFEDRLVDCRFTLTFTEVFTLTEREVQELGLGEEFIGATATLTVTIRGTAQVIVPGS